jgi:hypothetical protein
MVKAIKYDRCIHVIKTKQNIFRRCKRNEIDNKLCRQHYNKNYIEKKKHTIVTEILNDIIIKISNESDEKCCICLENKEEQISINPSCCNGKQCYHFQCLEKHLCYYSIEFCCPICKKIFTTEIINNTFNQDQKKILINRIDNSINIILRKIKSLLNDFKRKNKILDKYLIYFEQNTFISFNQSYRYQKIIENKKNKLIEIYEIICKDQIIIENQLTKLNKIEKNITKTLKIYNDFRLYKGYMRNILEELNII